MDGECEREDENEDEDEHEHDSHGSGDDDDDDDDDGCDAHDSFHLHMCDLVQEARVHKPWYQATRCIDRQLVTDVELRSLSLRTGDGCLSVTKTEGQHLGNEHMNHHA